MNEEEFKKAELQLKKINTLLAALGSLGVIASIWFGFSQLRQQSEAQTRAIQEQWKQTFYDEKMTVYTRATEAAGRIASLMRTGNNEQEITKTVVQFRTFFWGPMCITEGTDVEQAMVKFNQGLNADLKSSAMEKLALYLAHVCRNEAHAHYFESEGPASRYGNNSQILKQMDGILNRGEPVESDPGSAP